MWVKSHGLWALRLYSAFFPTFSSSHIWMIIKKTERRRIEAFKLWCWRTLESPLDSKGDQTSNSKGNQPWILEGLMLKLKLQYFGHLMQRVNSLEKNPDAGKDRGQVEEWGNREWDGWITSPSQWTWTWVNSGRWWGKGRSGVLQSMGLQRVRHDLVTEYQQQRLYSVGTWLEFTCSAGSRDYAKCHPGTTTTDEWKWLSGWRGRLCLYSWCRSSISSVNTVF